MRTGAILALVLLAAWPAHPVAKGQELEPEPAAPTRPILGARAALERPEDGPMVVVAAGTSLRTAPDRRALELEYLEVAVELPLLALRGRWLLVRLGQEKGWIEVSDAVELPADLDLGLDLEPASGPRPAARLVHQLDRKRIERARASMSAPRERALGRYRLLTDVEDERLLGRLARLAEQVPGIYESRYGLAAPALEPPPEVVLFRRESDYRGYTAAEGAISELDSSGHASGSVAVLFLGERAFDELAAVLLHELGHLLSVAVFGIELPVWLEEGLADDLAYGRVDEEGVLFPGQLRGSREVSETTLLLPDGSRRIEQTIEVRGPRVALAQAIAAWDAAGGFDLERLLGLTWLEFVMGEDRRRRYAEAAFLVRYLIEAEDGRHAEGFRSYLSAALLGAPLGPRELLDHVGLELEQLERDFEAWARARAGDPWPGRRKPK